MFNFTSNVFSDIYPFLFFRMELAGINVAGMAQTFGEVSLVLSDLVRRAKVKKRKAKRVSPGDVPPDQVAELDDLSVTPLAVTSPGPSVMVNDHRIATRGRFVGAPENSNLRD